jgi:hypothetical protein
VTRLQSAVARVLPAIEATLARLGAAPMPPREMEQAARALSSLTRTLRELNGLLEQHKAPADRDDGPEDIDESASSWRDGWTPSSRPEPARPMAGQGTARTSRNNARA